MLRGTCHCGAVTVEIPRKPRRLTSCNCSICRRHGGLWAYYNAADVRIMASRGATTSYMWGDRMLRLIRCSTCGCVTHWEAVNPSKVTRMGVNIRNFDPAIAETVRIRRLDGAKTWKFLD